MTRDKLATIALSVIAVAALLVPAAAQQRRQAATPEGDPKTLAPNATAAQATYVGRHVCRECHAENHRLHAQHGHASTFSAADRAEIAGKFVGKTFDAGEHLGTFSYQLGDDGLVARLPDKIEAPFPLQYALGSGHNAITLLSLIGDPEHGTVAIEHSATWYHNDDVLGSTPGQKPQIPQTVGQLFGDRQHGKVMERCVYCHTTTGRIVDQQIVDLTPNVNCEKCHGPASEHVRLARMSSNPPPFSVGRDDWDAEAEIQLCGDCHRLPRHMSLQELRDYPAKVVRFQPVGMLRSKCYLESDGQMTCTTCHDPHTPVTATSRADHEQRCIDCHLQDSPAHVACPVSPQQGCVDCHMPSPKFDHGIRFHDHWIRVREDQP